MLVAQRSQPARAFPSDRFAFLDALRGIAALIVMFTHAAGEFSPAIQQFVLTRFNVGHGGVIVFFLISGYIIPISLAHQGSLRTFWIRRVFRLFPLYWVSLLGFALLRPFSWHSIVANATMLQFYFGAPYVNEAYWSLEVELLFYVTASLFFVFGAHRQPAWIAVGFMAVNLIVQGLLGWGASFWLATFLPLLWLGSTIADMIDGKISKVLTLSVAVTVLIVSFALAPPEMGLPWIGAFVIFGIGLALRDHPMPAGLQWLGRVSYGVYLLHPLVFATIPKMGHPLLTMLVCLGVTLLLAEAAHRWIEQPGVALGRHLTKARSAAAPARLGATQPVADRFPATT